MGLLLKASISIWVQSRLDPCPKDTYIHIYSGSKLRPGAKSDVYDCVVSECDKLSFAEV